MTLVRLVVNWLVVLPNPTWLPLWKTFGDWEREILTGKRWERE